MPKKSLRQLQYENEQLENSTNKWTSIVLLGFIGFWPALILFIWFFAGH